jgi:hypothetical protein
MTEPASPSEKVKAFIADLARPFILYASAIAASSGVVMICEAAAKAIRTGGATIESGAMLLGVVLTGVGAIFIGKGVENVGVAKQKAAVETAAIQAAPPQNVTMDPSPPSGVGITPAAADEGILPPEQRVHP